MSAWYIAFQRQDTSRVAHVAIITPHWAICSRSAMLELSSVAAAWGRTLGLAISGEAAWERFALSGGGSRLWLTILPQTASLKNLPRHASTNTNRWWRRHRRPNKMSAVGVAAAVQIVPMSVVVGRPEEVGDHPAEKKHLSLRALSTSFMPANSGRIPAHHGAQALVYQDTPRPATSHHAWPGSAPVVLATVRLAVWGAGPEAQRFLPACNASQNRDTVGCLVFPLSHPLNGLC
jgi:hypothetical protein